MTVACVLRLGGDFDRSWVWALKRGLNRHLKDFRFVCLTDDAGVESYWRKPFLHAWPKWWGKIELFRPGLFDGPVLYMDLDTLPVGDLTDLASYAGEFAMIEDLFRTGKGKPASLQSGVMAFNPGPVSWSLWERFMADPALHMKKHRGDGEWLAAHVPSADRLQALYPGQIVSFKREARKAAPNGARLVCGHGRPRFSSPEAGWAHQRWRSLAIEGQTV